jgi:hypothetical protein
VAVLFENLGAGELGGGHREACEALFENCGARLNWVIDDCLSTFLPVDNKDKTTSDERSPQACKHYLRVDSGDGGQLLIDVQLQLTTNVKMQLSEESKVRSLRSRGGSFTDPVAGADWKDHRYLSCCYSLVRSALYSTISS